MCRIGYVRTGWRFAHEFRPLPNLQLAVKLGRRKADFPRPALRFAAFLPSTLPTPPTSWDGRPEGVVWPMYANDKWGDCVLAARAHQLGLWTLAELGKEALFTDEQVLGWYSAITGFDPRRPWTDRGTVIQDSLDYGVKTGFSGHRLAGYVSVNHNKMLDVQLAAWVFGGVSLGLEMPAAWQDHTGPGRVWDIGPSQNGIWAPGSWGGHDVPVVSYSYEGSTVITWGKEQLVTWSALGRYCDEVWASASLGVVCG